MNCEACGLPLKRIDAKENPTENSFLYGTTSGFPYELSGRNKASKFAFVCENKDCVNYQKITKGD
ncbi:hypothetical protein HY844_01305 [Candidatus Berkelbacteria bacterium]|nr:hypothetical protein [Candidatus Berkelbacteria bacterium]